MAGPGNSNNRFSSQMYLSPNQQDLLMAALNSNNPNAQMFKQGQDFGTDVDNQQLALDAIDPGFFPPGPTDFGNVNLENIDDSPFVDYLDGDTSFDFDAPADGDLMIGSLPGGQTDEGDSPEKRKSPEDDDEDPDGGGKRREPEDKMAKKPGRKPLTSEPTTKRKAQNRAAQRAFRERKEKHLKDLETKVAELEKESDAANHENGLLRAQVQRLQTELREYRKRLSSNGNAVNRSPQSNAFTNYPSHLTGGSNFQFEFPKFGNSSGQLLGNGMPKSTNVANNGQAARNAMNNAPGRQNSSGRSLSPKSQSNGGLTGVSSPEKMSVSASAARQQSRPNVNATSPPMFNSIGGSPFDMGNSPTSNGSRGRTESSSGQSRVFQFNSGSTPSSTNSPSASSISQYGGGPNSSCGTSPEPTNNSPVVGKADSQLDANAQGYVCHGNTEGEITFCEKLNMACGTRQNPVPRAMSISNGTPANSAANPVATEKSSIDALANQNGGQFDPTLFGEYRDPQTAIVGEGDFTGGFFDDAFNLGTFGSPFTFEGITPGVSTNKANPLEEIEKIQDGVDDEVVPADDMTQMLNCHNIWDKLAQRADFKDGTIDIDNLCSELRAKARCSESGVVVDNKDVEAALKRLPDGVRM